MSAVEYVCPEGCGFRGFDEPGGTTIVCPNHISGPVRLVQNEKVPDDMKNETYTESGMEKDRVRKVGNDPAQAERLALLEEYKELSGYKADRRWSDTTLRANVEYEREQAATRAAEAEAAAAAAEAAAEAEREAQAKAMAEAERAEVEEAEILASVDNSDHDEETEQETVS